MAYIKQNWENNPPSTATPISASRLDHLETQYDEAITQVTSDISDPGSEIGNAIDTTVSTTADAAVTAGIAPVYLELARTTAPVRRVEDGLDGVVGGTTVDNSDAIQQIISEAGRGGTIVFTQPGPSATLRIDKTLHVTDGQQRFVGESGDAYWTHLWTNAPITMIESRFPGTYVERLAFWSDKTVATANATAIELWGDADANTDAQVLGCTFIYMDAGVVHHGKNLVLAGNGFSNSKTGIRVGGRDLAYHTGVWDSRGIFARGNTFHTMGATVADAAIDIPATVAHRQSTFDGNVFNGTSKGTDVRVIGNASTIHRQIDFTANKHYGNLGRGYQLDFLHQFSISGARLTGVGSGSGNGTAVAVTNATDSTLTDISVRAYNRGFQMSNMTHAFLRGLTANSNNLHGFDFGTGMDRVLLDSIVSYGNGSWGLSGPAALVNLQAGIVYAYFNTSGQINPSLGIPTT